MYDSIISFLDFILINFVIILDQAEVFFGIAYKEINFWLAPILRYKKRRTTDTNANNMEKGIKIIVRIVTLSHIFSFISNLFPVFGFG